MKARIATLCQGASMARSVEGNRTYVVNVLRRVLDAGPDLVCLPEAFTAKGVPTRSVADVAETVPGPTTDALRELAARHRCHIVCAIYTRREERFHNSAVLIARDGSIAGIYDKRRPCAAPSGEVFEEGVSPGADLGVFDLDIGRIGVRICMDVNFPEDWTVLASCGVQAVVWPSASDGGILLQAHAALNHYYVISSVRTGRARVANPCGAIVAETRGHEPSVVADVNLDFAVAHSDFNARLAERIAARCGPGVAVQRYREEGLYLIEPPDGVTAGELQAEVAFERVAETIDRHLRAYERFARRLTPASPRDPAESPAAAPTATPR